MRRLKFADPNSANRSGIVALTVAGAGSACLVAGLVVAWKAETVITFGYLVAAVVCSVLGFVAFRTGSSVRPRTPAAILAMALGLIDLGGWIVLPPLWFVVSCASGGDGCF